MEYAFLQPSNKSNKVFTNKYFVRYVASPTRCIHYTTLKFRYRGARFARYRASRPVTSLMLLSSCLVHLPWFESQGCHAVIVRKVVMLDNLSPSDSERHLESLTYKA